jgi:hypothetical protein
MRNSSGAQSRAAAVHDLAAEKEATPGQIALA